MGGCKVNSSHRRVDELEGSSAWDLVHPDDLDYALGSLAEAEEFDGAHDPSQIRVLRRDGTFLSCEIAAHTPGDGELLAMSIRDISGRDSLPERRSDLEKLVLLVGGECAGASLDGLDALLEQLAGGIGSLVSAHEVLVTSVSPDESMVGSWSWRRPSVEHLLAGPDSATALRSTAAMVTHPGRIWMQLQPQAVATVSQPVEVDGEVVGMLTIAWHHTDARRLWDEGRVGGDEFVVLCPGSSEENATQIGRRLEEGLCGPAVLAGGIPIDILASLGVVRVEAHAPAIGRADDVLELADQSMYEAKASSGQSTVHASLCLSPGPSRAERRSKKRAPASEPEAERANH
jgi:hypothetical protein